MNIYVIDEKKCSVLILFDILRILWNKMNFKILDRIRMDGSFNHMIVPCDTKTFTVVTNW